MEQKINAPDSADASKYPEDGKPLVFTDLQGIARKGIYRGEFNGYQEISEVELPGEGQFVFPEDDIVSWEYRHAH